jgi:hypothetical protein
MKKGHLDLQPDRARLDGGQLAVLYDFAGELLPSARRELAQPPSVMLRKSVEVWTPQLAAQSFAPDEWVGFKEAGDEVWGRHDVLHTLGYPSTAMRMIPWLLARHQMDGYVITCVNDPPTAPHLRTTLIHCDANTGAPIDSVRWELLREGLEDFEMLRMLRTAIDESSALKDLDRRLQITLQDAQRLLEEDVPAMVRSARDFSWDASAMESIRLRAGDMLSQLTTPEVSR